MCLADATQGGCHSLLPATKSDHPGELLRVEQPGAPDKKGTQRKREPIRIDKRSAEEMSRKAITSYIPKHYDTIGG